MAWDERKNQKDMYGETTTQDNIVPLRH